MTEEERKASRKATLRRYRVSRKNYENQLRYRKKNMEMFAEYSRKRYWKDPEHARELSRKRYATEEGKAIRDAIEARYNAKNRIKRLAKDAVHNAKARGTIVPKGCEVCGSFPTEGHHTDYRKPLLVTWLCHRHHKMLHTKLRKSLKSKVMLNQT